MLRLAATAYIIIAPTVMGMFIVAVLVMQMGTGHYITWAAAAGLVVAIPVAWFVADRINRLTSPRKSS